MLNNIIKNYTINLTKDDIIKYSNSINYQLKENEVDIIYITIKNNIDNILINPIKELDKIKDKLDFTTYLKLQELINKYKIYL